MTASVEIRALSHSFGNFQALKGIDLSIDAGSFSVLLGPSGCGKTTLLSVLGGFIQPSGGNVLIDGIDVTHTVPARRPTTTMFQDYALFPHMSLLNNVGFGLRMRRQAKKERHHKATELLALVGLEASAYKKPHELSGGQRQRVALARALAVDPDVLLLDEPLGALDLKLRRQMQDELKAIQRRVGTTFIHVTHDQEEAMSIADTIIVMNAGQIEDSGTPESIYLKPRSLFSAQFMGEMNLLDGLVTTVAGDLLGVKTDLGEFSLPARTAINNDMKTNDRVCIAFRPEHMRSNEDSDDATILLGSSTLTNQAFFGTHQRCQVRASNEKIYTVHLPQSQIVKPGQSLPLRIQRDTVILFKQKV